MYSTTEAKSLEWKLFFGVIFVMVIAFSVVFLPTIIGIYEGITSAFDAISSGDLEKAQLILDDMAISSNK